MGPKKAWRVANGGGGGGKITTKQIRSMMARDIEDEMNYSRPVSVVKLDNPWVGSIDENSNVNKTIITKTESPKKVIPPTDKRIVPTSSEAPSNTIDTIGSGGTGVVRRPKPFTGKEKWVVPRRKI